MRSIVTVSLIIGCVVLFAACGGGSSVTTVPPDMQQLAPHAIGEQMLGNLTYVLTDVSIRTSLAAAGMSFSVTLRDGKAQLPVRDATLRDVMLLPGVVAYGDVTGDGQEDAVTVLSIGEGTGAILEVAVVSSGEDGPMHLASYSLGKATLKWLAVEKGKAKVNFVHQLLGDADPRNTEYTFSVTVSPGSGGTLSSPMPEPFPAGRR